MIFAILDTNVVVSYFLSKKDDPPALVMDAIFEGKIVPVYNCCLIDEYRKVLSREEFGLNRSIVDSILDIIQSLGFGIESFEPMVTLPDKKDIPIFELALLTHDMNTILITGNTKHFPNVDFVITPKQATDLLSSITI